MAKQELERIKEWLTESEQSLKYAKKYAEQVGDRSGADRIQKHADGIKETREDFDRRSK